MQEERSRWARTDQREHHAAEVEAEEDEREEPPDVHEHAARERVWRRAVALRAEQSLSATCNVRMPMCLEHISKGGYSLEPGP